MCSRRRILEDLDKEQSTHAGLWLDKYIRSQNENDISSRQNLVQQVTEIPVPDEYTRWFNRWRNSLKAMGAECREVESKGRLAVGLGDESVLETSITLHHTYGVPYIPGSALKGLASRFARQHLDDDWQGEPFKILFGDFEQAGFVVFFDALPFPNSISLHQDIITVHHRDYYGNDSAPTDFDSPNPIPFLSATGKFIVALNGPNLWVKAAFEILENALNFFGVGGKTSSGYGRMCLSSAPPIDPEEAKVNAFIERVKAMKKQEVAGSINALYQEWKYMDLEALQKRKAALAIVEKIKEAGREKKSKEKGWYQELTFFIDENNV